MILSNNNIVTVNRGDDFTLPVILNKGSNMSPELFNLKAEDVIYLGVMEYNMTFETAVIRKHITGVVTDNNKVEFTFNSDDTINLLPGLYYYMVKVVIDGKVTTILDKTQFRILD